MSKLTFPTRRRQESDWKVIAQDYEGQLGYLLRRCLAAEGNEGLLAMEALIADAESASRV